MSFARIARPAMPRPVTGLALGSALRLVPGLVSGLVPGWVLGSALALGASAASAQTLDLSQAYAAALSQDATLRAARAAAEAGRELLPQARAQLLPNASASVARNRNEFSSAGSDLRGNAISSQENYGSSTESLVLRQPLYRPYQAANLRQARARVESTDAQLERETQSLATRLSEAYFELLLADEQIALVEAQKAAYATQLDAATKAFAAGSGTRTDIDEVRARLDLAVAQELEARQRRLLARRQLQAIVVRPFDAVAPLDVATLQARAPESGDLEGWLELAERNSPEIRALQAQVEAARQEVGKARAGHLPTLDAVAQWSRSDSDNINRIGSQYSIRSLGVQLSVPLYAGGAIDSAVRQALAEQTRLQETLQALRHDLTIRIYREYAGITEGALRIRALEQAVRSAEQMVTSSRKSFRAGSRTTVDILNAEQQRVSAMRDLAQARLAYLLSHVRLQSLAGVFDDERLGRLNTYFAASPAAAHASASGAGDVTTPAAADPTTSPGASARAALAARDGLRAY